LRRKSVDRFSLIPERFFKPRFVFLTLFFVSFSGFLSAADLEVSHRARALQPGEVVLIRVYGKAALGLRRARLGERSFPLVETAPGRWLGLVGLDLSEKAGPHRIRFEGSNGILPAESYVLEVLSKEFPVRRLQVDSKYVSPPPDTMKRIKEERELVGSIFQHVSESRYWRGPFIAPVSGEVISSFGKRSILNGVPRSPHSGTDFRSARGTDIRSPNHGRVVLVRNLYFAGNTVIIDHGLGLYSYFAHLSAFNVKPGDRVEKGQVIGKVGATGRVTGPHLHWSLRLNGARVDPISLVEVLSDFVDPLTVNRIQ